MNQPDTNDFDWDELLTRLGERDPGDESPDLSNDDFKAIHRAVLTLLRWAVEPTRSKRMKGKQRAMTVAKRVVALSWVICPELFDAPTKDGASMTSVASSIGLHRAVLSEITADFSRAFGVRNSQQLKHGWNHKRKRK